MSCVRERTWPAMAPSCGGVGIDTLASSATGIGVLPVFQRDPERPEQARRLSRVRYDLVVAHRPGFHGSPPPPYYGGERPRGAQARDRVCLARFSLDTRVWNTRSII